MNIVLLLLISKAHEGIIKHKRRKLNGKDDVICLI